MVKIMVLDVSILVRFSVANITSSRVDLAHYMYEEIEVWQRI